MGSCEFSTLILLWRIEKGDDEDYEEDEESEEKEEGAAGVSINSKNWVFYKEGYLSLSFL